MLVSKNKALEEALDAVKRNLDNHVTSFGGNRLVGNSKVGNTENYLLSLLLKSAERNTGKVKTAYRHDDTVKMFMAYLKMLGGTLFYQTVHANLRSCIPSPSGVNKYIADKGPRITEGVLRSDELLEYLNKRNLPLIVSVSEDGTRMIGKICYDSHTNKLVGFSLPLNNDGMPKTDQFMARNVEEIQSHFNDEKNSVSTIAYTIMAQPLVENVAPFSLTLFSTNNKFTANDVISRWYFIRKELRKKGIEVLSYASDGDQKLLKGMKIVSGIGNCDETLAQIVKCKWFNCKYAEEFPLCFQDMIHLLTKLRNRLLRATAMLPFGNGNVSKTFFKALIDTVSKDKHCLTETDIDPKDRQNSLSASKMCNTNTQQCLLEYVPGSKPTVLYLRMMQSVTDSMLDPNLTIKEKIAKMWYGVFVVRIWRSWLSGYAAKKKSKKNVHHSTDELTYSLTENFISVNAYTCIEINAHSLILLTIKLRDINRPELFLTHLLGSQSCESTFRQLRSMTSTEATVINFTMLEMINRLKKVQLLSDIVTDAPGEIKFPRIQNRKTLTRLSEFPTDEEILDLIEDAKKKASADVLEIGIDVEKTPTIDFKCQVLYDNATSGSDDLKCLYDPDDKDIEDIVSEHVEEFDNLGEDESYQELSKDLNTLSSMTGPLNLKVHTYSGIDLSETSPYCIVSDGSGNEEPVRKSSICWFLSRNKHSLSSDRLTRVKQSELAIKSEYC